MVSRDTSYDALRLNGAVRGIVIAYGVGLTMYFMTRTQGRPVSGLTWLLVGGLAVQGLLALLRRMKQKSSSAEGEEMTEAARLGLYTVELVADGLTVFGSLWRAFGGSTARQPRCEARKAFEGAYPWQEW